MARYMSKKTFALLLTAVFMIMPLAACRNNNTNQNVVKRTEGIPVWVSDTPAITDSPVITVPPTPSETPSVTEISTETPTAVPTDTPDASPTASTPDVTPVPTAVPTPAPTAAPVTVSGLTWLNVPAKVCCDLNFDGKLDLLELSYSQGRIILSVTVGKNGKNITVSKEADGIISAFVNDFGASGSRYEIVVSAAKGTRNEFILCARLNGLSSDLDTCLVDGWVDGIIDDKIKVARKIDVIGTWTCTSEFRFTSSGFSLDQVERYWNVVPEEGRWCTLSQQMFINYYTSGLENEMGFIYPGYRLVPVGTDLETKIDLRLDTMADAFISITVSSDGKLLYEGKEMSEYFSDLTFIN
ncbi:MAG: hypothetical protein K6F68_00075 [Clostridiales bacterium]|nr:hypothetical protein [Clostridiales bacterium]